MNITKNILRYGLMKRFKRGVSLSIALTFRCNLRCPYCVVDKPQGKTPRPKESTLKEIQHFINYFPYKLREVKLTGGSPELHPDFVRLVYWLLKQGYFVKIFTNLMRPDILEQLPKSRKLMFIASYHHSKKYDFVSIPVKKYMENYNRLKGYRIEVEEIGERLLPFSRVKKEIGEQEMKVNKTMLRVSPDLKIYINCWDVYEFS